jgi:GWxTD domain-containing protein
VFTDKITITLSKNFDIRIDFIDQKSNDSGSWQYEFQVLPPSSLLSDLELSNDVLADSTNYLQKFHREEQLFQIIPNHILNKNSTEYCFVYWEIYNPFAGEKVFTINKTLTFRDSIIFQEMENEKFSGLKKTKLEKIRISDLDDGLYEYNIQVMCDSLFDFRQDYFSIKSEKLKTKRIFRDLEDEFLLVSYFLSSDKTSSWPSLTKSGKLAFIDRFWNANDPQPETEENDFYEKVKERVNYCNQQFYHFNKGWKTDRGRIYIKHGAPDEIIKGNTGLNTKYTQKEYEIWKYRTKTNITFIFVDLQMNGNHKLIYSDGDDNENTYSNWESYLGTDFDPTVLE